MANPRWKSSKPGIDWVNTVPGTRTNFSGSKNITGFSWQATEKTIFRRRKKHLFVGKMVQKSCANNSVLLQHTAAGCLMVIMFFCELRRGHSVHEIAMITSNVLVKNQLSQLKMVVVSNFKLVKSIDNIYVYIYICVCVCICKYIYIYIYMCVCACMYVCMSVCMYVCMYVCLSVCMSVCLYVCMSVCLYVCLSVCMSVCLYVCLSVCLYVCICTFCLHMYVCMYASACMCMYVCMCVCECMNVLMYYIM